MIFVILLCRLDIPLFNQKEFFEALPQGLAEKFKN